LQVLESHGVKTVNKVQLGTTPVVRGRLPPASWISTRNTPATGHSSSKMKTIRHGKTPKPGMRKSKTRRGTEQTGLADPGSGQQYLDYRRAQRRGGER
jgi:hypothetical protein